MTKQILTSDNEIVKPRHNLWEVSGHIVAFGTTTPSGFYWCYNCQCAECQHTQAVDVAWLAGQDSAEVPFNGNVPEDDEGMLFASSAALYGLNEATL